MDKKIRKHYHDARERFDPESLFDGKENYYRFRARYSNECIKHLCDVTRFDKGLSIADIGAGTGILSAQLFENGAKCIYLVEPNKKMLDMAKSTINRDGAHFCQATAEHTSLKDHSIDMIVVGTAFHWFKLEEFRQECKRIAKRNTKVIILRLHNFVPDITEENTSSYHSISGETERYDSFFGAKRYEKKLFFHDELFNENRFVMERLSDQNAPLPTEDGYNDFVRKAKDAFSYFGAKEIMNVFITTCIIGELDYDY